MVAAVQAGASSARSDDPVAEAGRGRDPRHISILGATGSIGASTIDLVRRHRESFVVEAVTAGTNVRGLATAAREVGARFAAIADPRLYGELRDALDGSGIEVAAGPEAVVHAAERPAEWVMAAIVGAAGLEPALAAIRRKATLALANKETLVCAGGLMMAEVERHGAILLPVDSEHSAIFQVFDFARVETVDKIVLTASGGPFRVFGKNELAKVTPAQAIAHPNWSMGAKISVDSATMMNKGLELIEAHHLFALPESRIDVLIHPQSIVHSLVTYRDGSVLAQMGVPDMRTPIAYALAWPTRMSAPVETLNLAEIGSLTFEAPDPERFPALRLARQALQTGGSAPTILNAANEVAVEAFLAERIGFPDIAGIVESALEDVTPHPVTALSDVSEIDTAAREAARVHVGRLAGR